MNDVCILIPSHERPAYLRRCVAYYANFPCKIVICDSSVTQYQETLAQNISYFHLPGKKFAEKVLLALDKIGEGLVALVPDDDFLFEGALAKGVHVLRSNPVLRACVGDVLAYPDKPPFRVIGRCSGGAANAVSASPEKNIETYLGHYHQILWSVFRRDALLLCFHGIAQAGFGNDNFFELTIATLCAGKGGIRYLDDYWILREVTQGEHWGSRHLTISKESVGAMEDDVRKFRHMIDGFLFTGAADLALSAYLARDRNRSRMPWLFTSARAFFFRTIAWAQDKILGTPAWRRDPRFIPMREAIGYQESV